MLHRTCCTVLCCLIILIAQTSAAEDPPEYLLQWGSFGVGNSQFNGIRGVDVGPSGDVYIADVFNHRIQKFTRNGTYLDKWGAFGSGNGQFSNPSDVAIDHNGFVYVADLGNDRIQKFTGTGTFVTAWGNSGTDDGEFSQPWGIAVDSDGDVYVTDPVLNRVQQFTSDGTFVRKWGATGTNPGQFQGQSPLGISVGPEGNVFVVDKDNHRVQKFTNDGAYLWQWGTPGSGDGQFSFPGDVAVDDRGDVYVVDRLNHRVQKFTNHGAYLTQWGVDGSGDGEFGDPYCIAIDNGGDVYVTDNLDERAQKFRYNNCYPVFSERLSTDAVPTPPPPVIYDLSWIKLTLNEGDSLFISGACDTLAPWTLVDTIFINGVNAGGGNDGDKGIGFPVGVPIDTVFHSVGPRNITDLVPTELDSFLVFARYSNTEVYGNTDIYFLKYTAAIVTGIDDHPRSPSISLRSYPNPFNPTATILYSTTDNGVVRLTVFDVLGRRVKNLVDEFREAGEHRVVWDGTATNGLNVATGVYFVRLEASGLSQVQKIVLLK